ncbi:MAG TPA: hypothetical protein V6D14_31225 [Coleofasciculaceae cyanobacterium]
MSRHDRGDRRLAIAPFPTQLLSNKPSASIYRYLEGQSLRTLE